MRVLLLAAMLLPASVAAQEKEAMCADTLESIRHIETEAGVVMAVGIVLGEEEDIKKARDYAAVLTHSIDATRAAANEARAALVAYCAP